MNRKFFIEAFKYGIVGVMNTLLTGFVIWLILKVGYGIKDDQNASTAAMTVSNFCGYTVGLINSFIINRNWTFKSKDDWKIGFLKFVLAFAICYVIQLGVVLYLNSHEIIPSLTFNILHKDYILASSYSCQLIGIVTYTVLNFFLNKYYTFKK